MTLDELIDRLRDACADAGSQKEWATAHGVSPQYVCDVLSKRSDPGPAICGALGVDRHVIYEPKQRKRA